MSKKSYRQAINEALSQEMARWSDVVVGDYNYYYDSTAMLYGMTQASQWKVAVLVDEAHNLVDRARRMYTGELDQLSLAAARHAAPKDLKKALDGLNRSWNALNKKQAETYQAYDAAPAGVLAAVQKAVSAITDHMGLSPLPQDDPVLGFYFKALHFMRLSEQFGSHALFDVTLNAAGSAGAKTPPSTLCLRNVIPAPYLAGRYAAAHATVLFSGTLSPQQFYRDTLGLPGHAAWIDVAAPFGLEDCFAMRLRPNPARARHPANFRRMCEGLQRRWPEAAAGEPAREGAP